MKHSIRRDSPSIRAGIVRAIGRARSVIETCDQVRTDAENAYHNALKRARLNQTRNHKRTAEQTNQARLIWAHYHEVWEQRVICADNKRARYQRAIEILNQTTKTA